MPFVLALSPSVSLFYSSSICELFNSSTQEWEGEGRVVLAVQREGKKIMIERWFKLQDSKVPKSHTSKGIRAENHSGQSPIIQQQRTVTRFPDRCDFKVECMPPTKKKIGNIERNSEVSTKWTICARRAQPAHFLGTKIWSHTYIQQRTHRHTHTHRQTGIQGNLVAWNKSRARASH